MASRMEKKLQRRRIRRKISFSLISIFIIFILALVITNNTMVRATGLPPDKNLITIHKISSYGRSKVKYIVDSIRGMDIAPLREKGRQSLERFLGGLKIAMN